MIASYRPSLLAPAVVLGAALVGIVPLIAFAVSEGGVVTLDTYTFRVLGFTLWQATLSTALSIIMALPAARALAWRRFVGRSTLMAMLAVPQALPAIVVVLALVSVFGTSGLLGGWFNLYGLGGIVLAHVFFNLPLAIRYFVETLESVQVENLRLSDQLGLQGSARWWHVEWPALKPVLPRVAALIFLLCAASFVIVLTFGGAAATTLEVAIFQSLRMDFDVARAVTLSFVQMSLCLMLVWLAGQVAAPLPLAAPLRLTVVRAAPMTWSGVVTIVLTLLLLLPPLAALLTSGINQVVFRPVLVEAAATSLFIAVLSVAMVLFLAWPMGLLGVRQPKLRDGLTAVSFLGLIVPPAVLATGWFIALRGFTVGPTAAVALIAALNAMVALPFALTLLSTAMADNIPQHDRLCAQLGLTGLARFFRIDLPALSRPLAQAGLMALVMSFGDLTAVMVLGTQGVTTLPSLVAQEMGNYRSASAQGTALVLAALCLAGTLAANMVGRKI